MIKGRVETQWEFWNWKSDSTRVFDLLAFGLALDFKGYRPIGKKMKSSWQFCPLIMKIGRFGIPASEGKKKEKKSQFPPENAEF